MRLYDFVTERYLPSRIAVSANWAKNLYSTAARFSRSLGRPANLADLTTHNISVYLAAYAKRWSARSTNNQRQILLMLWESAYRERLLRRAPEPELIRTLPVSHDPPEAWTFSQVQRLLTEADKQRGMIGEVPASLWWKSLGLTLYWTGCRIGALMATRVDCYRSGEGVLVRRQKNKRPQWYDLPPSCCEAIDRTEPKGRDVLWPWPFCRRRLFTEARRIAIAAGVPVQRGAYSLFHRMRRTTLSLCAAIDPAVAQRQADHADYRTTLQHYIDPRIARGRTAADILPDPTDSRPRRFKIIG